MVITGRFETSRHLSHNLVYEDMRSLSLKRSRRAKIGRRFFADRFKELPNMYSKFSPAHQVPK